MAQKTPLYQKHVDAGGKIVDFAGWQMPINYSSQLKEHNQVRQDSGMFDVSHMVIVDASGADTKAWLQKLLVNDVAKIPQHGKALYSCMCDLNGGIIDDLIVYHFDAQNFRIVVNAATREKDLAWMEQQKQGFDVELKIRDDLAMIAIQGPKVIEKSKSVFNDSQLQQIEGLERFFGKKMENEWMVARTGYTGEDGYEVMMPLAAAESFWDNCVNAGILPVGLGARDTLRLEAGMNLYGTDMDENYTPMDSGLSWTVSLDDESRNFNGRQKIAQQKQSGEHHRFIGLILEGKGILRNHLPLFEAGTDNAIGETTSGTFAPTVQQSIAFARVDSICEQIEVEIRGKRLKVKRVKLPFVKNGQVNN